jgi:hypothetical protein
MSTMEDLKAEVMRLEDELKTAKEKLANAIRESYPFQIGQLLEDNRRRRGILKSLDISYGWYIIPMIALCRKDGSAGMRLTPAFTWEDWHPVKGA